MPDRPTLFALASGALPCAIAILRISGPLAGTVPALFGVRAVPPRRAGLRRLRHPADQSLIDEAVLLFAPGPGSATGEDVLEIQCHGSVAVVEALETVLAAQDGFTAAGPGAFTRRAFENGRLDLVGVEALGDLLAAQTDRQRRAALALMEGGLSRLVEGWRTQLLGFAARLEMALDFAEEGDSEQGEAMTTQVREGLRLLADAMADRLARPGARRLHDGVRVVIAGPPNAGKSTLFNALIGRDAAIVTPVAGTTRDVIEAAVILDDVPFVICDTAGLRETRDMVEAIGIDRATQLLRLADIVLWLDDPERAPDGIDRVVPVATKSDLQHPPCLWPCAFAVSGRTGEGLNALTARLCELAKSLLPGAGDFGLGDRQHALLGQAAANTAQAAAQEDELLIAEEVRRAVAGLDALTGRSETEAVLDMLFSRFCVGK